MTIVNIKRTISRSQLDLFIGLASIKLKWALFKDPVKPILDGLQPVPYNTKLAPKIEPNETEMNLSCINTVTPRCHKKLHTSLANKVRKGGHDSLLMIGRTTTLQPNLVNLRNRVNAVVATKANLRIAVVDMADSSEKKQSEEPSVEKKPEVAPPPPEKPLPGDCCGSGCVRCVWDMYYEELEEYNNRIKSCSGNDDRSKKS